MAAKASPFEGPGLCIEHDEWRGTYMASKCGSFFPVLSVSTAKTFDLPCGTIGRSRKAERLQHFSVKHYVCAWFLARSAVSASRHDIAIFKALEEEETRSSGRQGRRRRWHAISGICPKSPLEWHSLMKNCSFWRRSPSSQT